MPIKLEAVITSNRLLEDPNICSFFFSIRLRRGISSVWKYVTLVGLVYFKIFAPVYKNDSE